MFNTHKSMFAAVVGVGVVSSLCTMVTVLGFQATADQNPTTDTVPRLIPYNGTLEFNGEPVTKTGEEAPWITFGIIDNSPAPGLEPGVVYTQSMQVNVFGGKFTAMLGPSDDFGVNIGDVIKTGDDLTLQMTILGEHDPNDPASTAEDDVTLSNPQKLVMSPFAMWATNATNFDVADHLRAGKATIEGNLTMPNGNLDMANGSLAMNTGSLQLNTGSLTLGTGSLLMTSGELRMTSGDLRMTSGNLRMTNGSISDDNGSVIINDGLQVSGDITDSNGDVIIDDGLQVNTHIKLNDAAIFDSVEPYVWINDGLWVENNLTLDAGHIHDTNGSVMINDSLEITGGVKFDCDGCGSSSTLFGDQNWGDLIIQGRVLSANSNLHLSPPGGHNVVINNDYRSSGGTSTGKAGLTVEGDITSGNTSCRSNTDTCGSRVDAASHTSWGSWSGMAMCPARQFVCGIELRSEGNQNSGDDTGVNDLRFRCCKL